MATYLLGIDVGTSACKAALFQPNGEAVAQAASEYPVYYPKAGWAEQNPEDWWAGVCKAVLQILQNSGISPADIAAVGVDGQSWSAIAADAQGVSLCNTPIWTDTRARFSANLAAIRVNTPRTQGRCTFLPLSKSSTLRRRRSESWIALKRCLCRRSKSLRVRR